MVCLSIFRSESQGGLPRAGDIIHGTRTRNVNRTTQMLTAEDMLGPREWELRAWDQWGRHTHHIDCSSVRDRDRILPDRMTLAEIKKGSELTIIVSINVCVSYS